VGRPASKNKLQTFGVALDAETRELLRRLADDAGMSKSQYGAELLLLGLLVRTGKNLDELLNASSNGHVTDTVSVTLGDKYAR
jgi:hypothetical protein